MSCFMKQCFFVALYKPILTWIAQIASVGIFRSYIKHMGQNIAKIFKNIHNFEPSAQLEVRILKAVAMEKAKILKRKLMFARSGMVASALGLAYALGVFGRAFLESDFWNLAKLVFSDTGIIVSHFGEFAFSLLETLPIVEIFAILVPIFLFFVVTSWYFKFSNNNNLKHA
jgi:hypothetical protein